MRIQNTFKLKMSNASDILSEEIIDMNKPIEEKMKIGFDQALHQQKELITKIQDLSKYLEQIESTLPSTEYAQIINKISELCNRLDTARHKINRVSQRAQKLISFLENKQNVNLKTGNFLDLS